MTFRPFTTLTALVFILLAAPPAVARDWGAELAVRLDPSTCAEPIAIRPIDLRSESLDAATDLTKLLIDARREVVFDGTTPGCVLQPHPPYAHRPTHTRRWPIEVRSVKYGRIELAVPLPEAYIIGNGGLAGATVYDPVTDAIRRGDDALELVPQWRAEEFRRNRAARQITGGLLVAAGTFAGGILLWFTAGVMGVLHAPWLIWL